MTEENNFYQEAHKVLEEHLPKGTSNKDLLWEDLLHEDLLKFFGVDQSENLWKGEPPRGFVNIEDLKAAFPKIIAGTAFWQSIMQMQGKPELATMESKEKSDLLQEPQKIKDFWKIFAGGVSNPVMEPNTHVFLENLGLSELTIGEQTYTAKEFAAKYPFIWPTVAQTTHEDLRTAWNVYMTPNGTIEDLKNVTNSRPDED